MSHLGWRFNFWIMFMVAAVALLGFIFVLPETVSTMAGAHEEKSDANYRFHAVCTGAAPMASAKAASRKRWKGHLRLPLRHHSPTRPRGVLARQPRAALLYVSLGSMPAHPRHLTHSLQCSS